MTKVYRILAAASAVLALAACGDEDYFDKNRYEELISESFPVISVDPAHDWTVPDVATASSLRYCFEDNFPHPGDYDFNDLVLTIEPRTSGRTVTLDVTLDAVGSAKQMAAAIRVKGLRRSDIVSADVRGDFDFNTGKPLSSYMIIDSKEFLLPDSRNLTQDVVINLFSDAHWAMGRTLETNGNVRRWCYNTVKDDPRREDWASVPPVTVVYTFEMATEEAARRVCAANLDAFIIENYNGIFMEVHTWPFKTDEVIYRYHNGDNAYSDRYIWALQLPGSFSYPLEGVVIGGNRRGVLSGAYRRPGHSFIDWVSDRTKSADWYLYPTQGSVYK